MGWVEHTTTEGSGERDAPGRGSIVRTFKVWDVTPGQALRDPTSVQNELGNPLPSLNSVHPDIPGWFLDRYRLVARDGAFTFILEADYSNTRRYYFREVLDPAREGFYSWGVSFRRDSFSVPYAMRETNRVVLSSNPYVFAEKRPWVQKEWKAPTNYTRITLIVNVPSFDSSARKIMQAQNGNIHSIEDLPYLYEAGDARQIESSRWVIEHNWVFDSGITESPFPDATQNPQETIHGPQQRYGSGFPGLGSQLWTRHPFAQLVMVPDRQDPEVVPQFRQLFSHPMTDLFGWRTLPGVRP